MKRLNSRGDTIIEVLLAMMVVSLILGGAYVSASRTLNNSRQAQERGEALKVAQSQLETIKNKANNGDASLFSYANTFCIDSSNNLQPSTNPTRTATPSLESDNFNTYTSACKNQGPGQLYYVTDQVTSGNLFSVYVRWDRAGGNGRDEVKLSESIYP